MAQALIVGIAGGTASGKTTIAELVAKALGDEVLLISHDRYYRDVSDPLSFNYDHPSALDTDELVQHVAALRVGRAAGLPIYDYNKHRRGRERELTSTRPVVIVEGILVLENEALRDLMDLKIYVDAPDDIRLVRRVRRDIAARGRDVDEVLDRWMETVRPMHMRYVESSRVFADMELRGVGLIEPLVDTVLGAIRRARQGLEVPPIAAQDAAPSPGVSLVVEPISEVWEQEIPREVSMDSISVDLGLPVSIDAELLESVEETVSEE